jgi:acetyltransferase-like isoleucine patch superfamily enzyme
VVIAGFCDIGESSFFGVNATIGNNVTIGADNWIGLGVTIAKDTKPNVLYKGPRFEPNEVPTTRFFKVAE